MISIQSHSKQTGRSGKISRFLLKVKHIVSILLVCAVLSLNGFASIVSAASEPESTASESSSETTASAAAAESVTDTEPSADTPAVDTAVTDTVQLQTALLDPQAEDAPVIDGKAYVLYDAQSGVFLLGSNQDTPLPPASITKVMTILLAFENLKMTDTITVTRDMYESIPNDYVRLGLVEGEVITVEDAIYACLLISANDACMSLAISMGGTIEGFSQMMNDRAVELGCNQTHFTNPYGYADENHLTTAHDMALIMAEALKNEMYTKISTTANYTMAATNKNSEPRGLTNGNRFVSTTTYAYENYIGGKTGFTDMSAYTIVAGARENGRTLIGVVLGASYSQIRYSDLISLFTYGFEKYSTTSVDPSEYAEIQKQTIDQVTTGIAAAGYVLEITDATLSIDPFCTTKAATAVNGYSTGIDISQAVIQGNLSTQVLTFPVFRQYADSSKNQVGTLTITICDQKSAETAAEAAAAANEPKTSIGAILARAGIVLLLVMILAFCIIIYVMLQKEKKRRKNRRKPRVL